MWFLFQIFLKIKNCLTMTEVKKGFISKHFKKIKKADFVLVANYDKKGVRGYIGSNTLMEIAVAFDNKKQIYILNEVGDQSCSEEVNALAYKNLGGDVDLI